VTVRRRWPAAGGYAGLALVFALAAVLRGLRLGDQSLFFDEVWSWAVARLPLARLPEVMVTDRHPLLYYAVLKGWLAIVPDSEAGLRALSVVCSLGALAIVVWFVRERWGTGAAVAAGWYYAWSSFDVYYAQEVRMYTLLALLSTAAYAALSGALAGRKGWLGAWAVLAILAAWTQVIGVLVAGAQSAAILGCLALQRARLIEPRLAVRNSLGAVALAALATLPVLLSSARLAGTSGSNWVPRPADLVALTGLMTAGLSGARAYFLDGTHLALPAWAAAPDWAWALAGTLTTVLFAGWGGWAAWRAGGAPRSAAVLALVTIVLPIGALYAYGALARQPVWALKPFIGSAVLLYMWAGVGLAQWRRRAGRLAIAAAVAVLALTSLWPYYTIWQKSDSRAALRALPALGGQHALVIIPTHLGLLAWYYLGADAPIYGVRIAAASPSAIGPIVRAPEEVLGQIQDAGCAALPPDADLWIYGHLDQIQREAPHWPDCVRAHPLRIFDGQHWINWRPVARP
jgi:mannosyltransferase